MGKKERGGGGKVMSVSVVTHPRMRATYSKYKISKISSLLNSLCGMSTEMILNFF